MKMSREQQIELSPDELDLLAWNVANEVINGFRVEDFQERVGTSVESFKQISNRLRSARGTEGATLNLAEARAFRNALAITLEELGDDEFETRTGHDFEKGNLLLKALNGFLDADNRA
jgi:hypothetical protein